MTRSINVIDGEVDMARSSTPRSPSPVETSLATTSDLSGMPNSSPTGRKVAQTIGCFDCDLKHQIIKDLRAEIDQLKQTLNESAKVPNTAQQRKRKYQPKTRPDVQMADYIEIGPSDVIPDNFHLLAPGASIVVNTLWLHDILSSLTKQRQKREKKADKKGWTIREDRNVEILKRLMNGFFDPWDLAVEGGTASFKDNAVFNALQIYATHHLKMSIPVFKKSWNSKMVSARQTVKRCRQQRTSSIDDQMED